MYFPFTTLRKTRVCKIARSSSLNSVMMAGKNTLTPSIVHKNMSTVADQPLDVQRAMANTMH